MMIIRPYGLFPHGPPTNQAGFQNAFSLWLPPVYKKQQHMNSSLQVISVRAYRHVSFLGAVKCLLLLLSGLLCTLACNKYSKQGHSQSNIYLRQIWKPYQLPSPALFTTSLSGHVITFSVSPICLTLNVYMGKLWKFQYPDIFDFKASLIKPLLTD